MYDIKFVNLGITIEHIKNSISIHGFKIAYYGIIIGIGMLCGIAVAMSDAKRRGQDPDIYLDFALYAIIFSIMGARAYYVLFSWDAYKDNLLEILNLRGGGLAIYGGVIAAVITCIVYTRIKQLSFFSMADTGVLGLVTGQIIGRWGNFFNCEAFGCYTNSLFAMRIRKAIVNPIMIDARLSEHIIMDGGTEYIQVHPTFLYESVWNLCLLMFMLWYRHRKSFDGELLFIYLGGYGLGRALIESLRTDQLRLPGTSLAVSQLIGILCFVISAVSIFIGRKRKLSANQKNRM